jgi:hypothetical protein
MEETPKPDTNKALPAEGHVKGDSRVEVLQVVKTPLTFFALALLATEGLFGFIALRLTGTDRTLSIIGVLILFAALLAIVLYLSTGGRLAALLGLIDSGPAIAALQNNVQNLKITNDTLGKQIQSLEAAKRRLEGKLEKLDSLKLHIIAIFGNRSLTTRQITDEIVGYESPFSRNEVRATIGQLLEDHTIEPDDRMPAGSYRLRRVV